MRALVTAAVLSFVLPAAAATITGTVVGVNGAPIANAEVVALPPRLPFDISAAAARTPIASTKTDAKGAFSVNVPGPRVVDLSFRAEGHAPADVIAADGDSVGTIVLATAGMVEHRVTTAGGDPVAGARLAVVGRDTLLTVTTDASGMYRLPDPAVWANMITVLHDDSALPYMATVGDIKLAVGPPLRGRVTDAAGNPAAGVDVSIDGTRPVKSRPDGTFSIPNVENRWQFARAHGNGGIATARPLADGDLVLKLRPSAHVRGVLRDAHGSPVAGVVLQLSDTMAAVITDAAGAYDLEAERGRHAIEPGTPIIFSFPAQTIDTSAGDINRDITVTAKLTPIDVKVVAADGKPLAGVMVSAVTKTSQTMLGLTSFAGTVHAYVDTATTSSILARPNDMPPVSAPLNGNRADITVRKGIAVSGIVLDRDRKPVAGVPIRSNGKDVGGSSMDGTFSFLLPAGAANLEFDLATHAKKEITVQVAEPMKPLEITLTRIVDIQGKVVSADSKPKSGVGVASGDDSSYSDAEGVFHLRVPEGPATIRYGSALAEKQEVVAPATRVTLVLPEVLTMRGRVVDAATKAPVAKFVVASQTVASPAGEFEIEVPDDAKVTVSAKGYATTTIAPDLGGRTLDVALQRGKVITGHVLTEDGAPIAGATITDVNRVSAGDDDVARSDDQGRFRVEGASTQTNVGLRFEKAGFARDYRVLKVNEDTIDVRLPRAVIVTGRVTDSTGKGVAGIEVDATSVTIHAQPSSVETDATGAFRFEDLGHGRYDFSAEVERNQAASMKDVDVDTVHDIALVLEKPPAAIISGRVKGVEGGMAAMVIVSDHEGHSQSGTTDEQGNFRITDAPAGTVDVQGVGVSTSRGELRSNKVTVDVKPDAEARVDLVLTPTVPVHGVVTIRKMHFAEVIVMFSGEASAQAETDQNGQYEVSLPPGEYDVTMRWKGYQARISFTRHVVVRDPMTLDFTVTENTATVTVVDADTSEPIDGAAVSAFRNKGADKYFWNNTGKEGRTIVSIEAGTPVTLRAFKEGYAFGFEDLTPQGDENVTIRLKRSEGVRVRIVDARDGRALGASVVARDSTGRSFASRGWVRPDGSMMLDIVPGHYDISASAEGYGSTTVSVEAGPTEIRIPLQREAKLLLRSNDDLRASARLIQPNGAEYVQCWCNGISTIKIAGRTTLVDRVAPGQYTLEVTPANGKVRRFPVTAVEGQTVSVSID